MVPWRLRKHLARDYVPTRLMTAEGTSLNKNGSLGKRLLSQLRTLLEIITPHWLLESLKQNEIHPNKLELQQFYWVRRSSHWDGESIPLNGFVKESLLYGTEEICYSRQMAYVDGVVKSTESKGDPRFLQFAELSEKYLLVRRIADHLGGERSMENFIPTVHVTPEIFGLLRKHRQFISLKVLWLNKGYDLMLISASARSIQVVLAPRTPRTKKRGVANLTRVA